MSREQMPKRNSTLSFGKLPPTTNVYKEKKKTKEIKKKKTCKGESRFYILVVAFSWYRADAKNQLAALAHLCR